MRAGLSSGGGIRHLRYLRLPFLTPPFDAGGRRGQENEAAEETEFLKGFSGRQLSKRTEKTRQAAKEGDSGGTSGEGGSALWVDSRGSGNRRKYRLKSENGAKAQKWGENSGKTSARHKAGRDRTLGMYRDSRERPSVGVTHFSLMTAAYLSRVLCRRTAVLEQNESGSFAQLEKIFRTGKEGKTGYRRGRTAV